MHGSSSPHADCGVPVSLMNMVRSHEMTSQRHWDAFQMSLPSIPAQSGSPGRLSIRLRKALDMASAQCRDAWCCFVDSPPSEPPSHGPARELAGRRSLFGRLLAHHVGIIDTAEAPPIFVATHTMHIRGSKVLTAVSSLTS